MNTQASIVGATAWPGLPRAVPYGVAVRLAGGDGRLRIVSGRLWVTCVNDLEDRFYGVGDMVEMKAAHGAVLEGLDRTGLTLVAWQPATVLERWRARLARLRDAARMLLQNAARAAAFAATTARGEAEHGSDTRISTPSRTRGRPRSVAQEAGGRAPGLA